MKSPNKWRKAGVDNLKKQQDEAQLQKERSEVGYVDFSLAYSQLSKDFLEDKITKLQYNEKLYELRQTERAKVACITKAATAIYESCKRGEISFPEATARINKLKLLHA